MHLLTGCFKVSIEVLCIRIECQHTLVIASSSVGIDEFVRETVPTGVNQSHFAVVSAVTSLTK